MSSKFPVTKVSLDVLRGPRLKTERADEHINQIITVSKGLPTDWFDFSVKPHTIPPHAKPTYFDLTYNPLKPIPEIFALMIGDAVHNLRSALDHLATAIVRQGTNDKRAKVHFPVAKNRDDLHGYGHLAKMESSLPGTEELIFKEIRPENNARDHLWLFKDINNDDKHNLIIPTVTIANITGINLSETVTNLGFGSDAARPFIAIRSKAPFAIQGDPQASVDVSFAPGSTFEGEPVVPTLLDVRQLIVETLDAFDRQIKSHN